MAVTNPAAVVPPMFSAHRSVALNVPTAEFTRVPLNSMDYDQHTSPAQWDSPNGVYVCRRSGLYLVVAHAITNANATGQRLLAVRINGADASYDQRPGHATLTTHLRITTVLALDSGQNVDIAVYQDSGGALGLQLVGVAPSLRMVYLGPKPALF